MPLHGSLKKTTDTGSSPRPNRTSCLRNRQKDNHKENTGILSPFVTCVSFVVMVTLIVCHLSI